MARLLPIPLILAASLALAGCYTLVKRGSQNPPPPTTAVDHYVVQEFPLEILGRGDVGAQSPGLGVIRSVIGASAILKQFSLDGATINGVLGRVGETDFTRQMLLVVAWGATPKANLVVEDVTVASGRLHVFVRPEYASFDPVAVPSLATANAPVVVVRIPAHDGELVMHMAQRFVWYADRGRWVEAFTTRWSAAGDLDRVQVVFEDWDQRQYAAEDFILN